MNIFRIIKVADLVTLGNAFFGLLSIFFSIKESFNFAAIFLLVAIVLDFFDGFIAKRLESSNGLGKEMDSLCDIISFGVAPVVFVYLLGFNQVWHMVVYFLFMFSGILRLARFNITNIKHFEGMPITVNGVIIPLMFFVKLGDYIIYFMIIAFILMISSIRFKKIR